MIYWGMEHYYNIYYTILIYRSLYTPISFDLERHPECVLPTRVKLSQSSETQSCRGKANPHHLRILFYTTANVMAYDAGTEA